MPLTQITIECSYGCNYGWDSYTVGGEIWVECARCERKIEGSFYIGKDGWVKRKVVA